MNNSSTPLVSICCLAYNHAPFIRQCLDGFVTQQTSFPFEVLIHDDASTDGTTEIIREYERLYPGIVKPVYQTENQYSKGVRVSSTYNFPRAAGKYIALCEGDDYWTDPLKLQKQVDFLEANPDYGFVHTDFGIVDTDNNPADYPPASLPMKRAFSGDIFYELVKRSMFPRTLTILFERSLMELYLKESDVNMDYSLFLFLAIQKKVHYLKEVTGNYRVNPKGMVQSGKMDFEKINRKCRCSALRTYFTSDYKRPLIENLKIMFLASRYLISKDYRTYASGLLKSKPSLVLLIPAAAYYKLISPLVWRVRKRRLLELYS